MNTFNDYYGRPIYDDKSEPDCSPPSPPLVRKKFHTPYGKRSSNGPSWGTSDDVKLLHNQNVCALLGKFIEEMWTRTTPKVEGTAYDSFEEDLSPRSLAWLGDARPLWQGCQQGCDQGCD